MISLQSMISKEKFLVEILQYKMAAQNSPSVVLLKVGLHRLCFLEKFSKMDSAGRLLF